MVRVRRWISNGVLTVVVVALTTVTASAQARVRNERKLPELETDRPDITESSSVVGGGIWQLESGILFQSDGVDAGTAHDVSAPNVLLRIGIGSRFELRFSAEGFLGESISSGASGANGVSGTGTGMSTGLSDLELGFKLRLLDQEHAGVDLAVIPIVSMPTGSDAFSSGGLDPTIKLTLARDLPGGFSIGGNAIASSITEDHVRFTQTAISASLGHSLGAHWSGFWELYGASALARGGGRAWLFDTGVTRAIGEHVQLDLSAGRGLNHDAPDWFIGAGFAVRGFLTRHAAQ
jgi:hypothetical protein